MCRFSFLLVASVLILVLGCTREPAAPTAAAPVAAAQPQKEIPKERIQAIAMSGQLGHAREIEDALDQMTGASEDQKSAILSGCLDVADFDWRKSVEITGMIAQHPGSASAEFLHKLGHFCAIVQRAFPKRSVRESVDATLEAAIAAGDNWPRLGENGGSSAIETLARIDLSPKEALSLLAAKVREGTDSERLFDAALAIKKQRRPDPPETPPLFLHYCLETEKRTADEATIWEAIRKIPGDDDHEKVVSCVSVLLASPKIATEKLVQVTRTLRLKLFTSLAIDSTIPAAVAGAANEAFPDADATTLCEIARRACRKEGSRAAEVYTPEKIKSLGSIAVGRIDGRP